MSTVYPVSAAGKVVEVLIDGEWVNITTDTRGPSVGGISITRGSSAEQSAISPATAELSINNRSGIYSNRNPASPYADKLGRNTPIRITLNEAPVAVDAAPLATNLHAPAVHFTGTAGLAIYFYFGGRDATGPVNLTLSGTLTIGTETDSTLSTSRSGTKTVAGPGTIAALTATSSAAVDRILTAAMVLPGAPTVAETLAGASAVADVTLTTAAGTAVGDWLIAFHVVSAGTGSSMGVPDNGPWTLADETVDAFASTSAGRLRVWMRPVAVAGANAVTFPHVAGVDTHARLIRVSGWGGGLPTRVARRFMGEVAEWPARWDTTGRDVWTPIAAAGIMRRVGQGNKPLPSAMYREAINALNSSYLVGYWPMEDGSDGRQFASALPLHPPMTILGGTAVSLAADSTAFPGSAALPTFAAGGQCRATIPGYAATSTVAVRMLIAIPAAGLVDTSVLVDIFSPVGSGGVRRWAVRYRTGGNLSLHGYDSADVELCTSGAVAFDVRGSAQMLAFNLTQSALDIEWDLFTRQISPTGAVTEGGVYGGTFTARNLAAPTMVVVGNGGNIADCTVGHVMVGTSINLAGTIDTAIIGHAGETAAARMQRLCDEMGIDFTVIGNPDTTERVGVQEGAPWLSLLEDAAAVDGGLLFEPRDAFGLAYRTRASLYNQTPYQLSYGEHHLAQVPLPTDDDRYLRNDVTVTRPLGSFARAVQTTGPLSVSEPTDDPPGVGTYDETVSLKAFRDDQLMDLAGWRRHLGTWDEARWPLVSLNLSRSVFTAAGTGDALTLGAAALDLGDLFSISNLPAWLPPDPVELIQRGLNENIENLQWTININATPGGPYRVAITDDPDNVLGRPDTVASELYAAVDADDTTMEVAVTEGPLWTVVDAHFPFDLNVEGERVTVTDILPPASASMQVGTVAHAVAASVTPSLPASVVAGDLLLCFAAAWSTGEPVAPAGWEELIGYDNIALFGRIATGADVAPTVTFGFTPVGTDTSAQIVRFRGGKYNDVSTALRGYARCTNASAQDITTPGLVVPERYWLIVHLGWKQDDWTSVAAPAGTAEIDEPDTTTGNDQGITWAWSQQGATVSPVASSSFVVTGGAAGLSRGIVAAFTDDRQTFTVTRNVNGIVGGKAHDAGAPVKLWYPMIPAL